VTSLALLLVGFSIFSAISLALTHFRSENYQDQAIARVAGLILLLALSVLQFIHFEWLYLNQAWYLTAFYRVALFTVAPAFYLCSSPLLCPQGNTKSRPILLIHALPLLAPMALSYELAMPLAFVVGAGYLLWLGRSLYAIRNERGNFRLEMYLLGAAFVIAVVVSILGLLQAALPEKLFFSLYAIAIGAAFLLVQTTLGLRPQLSTEISSAVQTAYSNTTLANVDCDAILIKLDQLMRSEQAYKDTDLNLPRLAENLALSTHQLSELMNSRLGKGFSRYLRELRVDAAKSMLLDEPSASVLSVGVSVGFTSQSNFYEAFREIEGMTPGQYRKLNAKNAK
jgi:AraC-like DNA-binding protein